MQGGFQSVGKTNTIGQVKITTQGTSYGVQQSDASRSAAPPPIPPIFPAAKSRIDLFAYGSPIVGFALALVAGMGFFKGMGLVLAFTVGGFILALTISDQPTEDEIAAHKVKYSDLYAQQAVWEQTFACGSCGHRFTPNPAMEELGQTAPA